MSTKLYQRMGISENLIKTALEVDKTSEVNEFFNPQNAPKIAGAVTDFFKRLGPKMKQLPSPGAAGGGTGGKPPAITNTPPATGSANCRRIDGSQKLFRWAAISRSACARSGLASK